METHAATPAHWPPLEADVVVPGAVVDFVVLTGGGVVVGVGVVVGLAMVVVVVVVEGGWKETLQLGLKLSIECVYVAYRSRSGTLAHVVTNVVPFAIWEAAR